ncbi:MAG TPA: hypothetical protein VNG04_06610 [Candidatus Acidoferrum sp.]|nr:hypothetical protein [Candidatus Acidoferrum sp.]
MASFLIRVQIAGGGLTTQNEIYFMETLIGVVGWLIAGIVTGLVLVRLFGELGPLRSTVVT